MAILGNKFKHLWQAPILRKDESSERKTSWLQLFFDLIFVVVIFELSYVLNKDISLEGFGKFLLLFIPTYLVWIGNTIYNERMETNDVSQRIITFFKILFLVGMAAHIHDAFEEGALGFAISYLGARLLLIFMWIRAHLHNKEIRPMTKRYILGFSISAFLWFISVFFEPTIMYCLWGIGVFIDFISPVFTLRHQKNLPRFNSNHLPERFGLFVMIVLGESIIAISRALIDQETITFFNLTEAGLGLAIVFALWWMYFDHILEHPIKKNSVFRTAAWIYSHTPMMIALISIGASMGSIMSGSEQTSSALILLSLSTAVSLLMMALIELTLTDACNAPCSKKSGLSIRLVGIALSLFVGMLALNQLFQRHEYLLLILILGVIILQVVYGIWNIEKTHQYSS